MDKFFIDDITVIGSGVAGTAFVNKVRDLNRKVKITLIDKNNFYFPKKQMTKDPINFRYLQRIDDWSKNLGVDFIWSEVEKINEKAKRINLANLEKVNFKNLVVASGAINEPLKIKGNRREGFFYLSEINPKDLKVLLRIYQEAVVFVTSLEGVRLSSFLRSCGKEVRVVASDLNFFGAKKEKIIDILKHKKIKLHLGYTLVEAIGEKSVKAVKVVADTNASEFAQSESPEMKVFSAQLVFADTKLTSNISFLNGCEAGLERKDNFTRCNQIYLIGDAAKSELGSRKSYFGNSFKAESEGKLLAEYLFN